MTTPARIPSRPRRFRWLGAAGVIAGTLLATSSLAAAGGDAHHWLRYSNARFGFGVCYPADLVQADGVSDNGDGQAFTAVNGARIAAWGALNPLHWSLRHAMEQDRRRFTDGGGTITYGALGRDTYVLSGHQGRQVFYNRTVVGPDRITAVEVTYPATDHAIWDEVATRLSRCLDAP